MKIDEIENGIVFDHITAGKGMHIIIRFALISLNAKWQLFKMLKVKKWELKI